MTTTHNGTQCSHITKDDFDDEVWDALCAARRMYVRNVNKALWYHALREFCGYRSSSVWIMKRMNKIVDEWLAQHPSWTGRFL